MIQQAPSSSPSTASFPASFANGSTSGAKQIRIGGKVQAERLVEKPEPDYPPLALQARIAGTVKFNVLIATDGTVANLVVVSGHPLLVPEAAKTVQRYRYQETLLNGAPVEVVTTVDVSFFSW